MESTRAHLTENKKHLIIIAITASAYTAASFITGTSWQDTTSCLAIALSIYFLGQHNILSLLVLSFASMYTSTINPELSFGTFEGTLGVLASMVWFSSCLLKRWKEPASYNSAYPSNGKLTGLLNKKAVGISSLKLPRRLTLRALRNILTTKLKVKSATLSIRIAIWALIATQSLIFATSLIGQIPSWVGLLTSCLSVLRLAILVATLLFYIDHYHLRIAHQALMLLLLFTSALNGSLDTFAFIDWVFVTGFILLNYQSTYTRLKYQRSSSRTSDTAIQKLIDNKVVTNGEGIPL